MAFGALGIPITVAGSLTGLPAHEIGQIAGRQLPLLALAVPFFMVFLMDGAKGVRQTWPALTVAGLSVAVTQFLTSNFLGPELPDITSALVSLVATATFLRYWQPSQVQEAPQISTLGAAYRPVGTLSAGRIIKA